MSLLLHMKSSQSKGPFIEIEGIIPTPKCVNIIIHFIIKYTTKQCFDNSIYLIHMFSVCIAKYILTNVWYNTYHPSSYGMISIDVLFPPLPVIAYKRTHTF